MSTRTADGAPISALPATASISRTTVSSPSASRSRIGVTVVAPSVAPAMTVTKGLPRSKSPPSRAVPVEARATVTSPATGALSVTVTATGARSAPSSICTAAAERLTEATPPTAPARLQLSTTEPVAPP